MLEAMRCMLIRERGAVSRVLPLAFILSLKIGVDAQDQPICKPIKDEFDFAKLSEDDQLLVYVFAIFMRQINTQEDLKTAEELAYATNNEGLKDIMLDCIYDKCAPAQDQL